MDKKVPATIARENHIGVGRRLERKNWFAKKGGGPLQSGEPVNRSMCTVAKHSNKAIANEAQTGKTLTHTTRREIQPPPTSLPHTMEKATTTTGCRN